MVVVVELAMGLAGALVEGDAPSLVTLIGAAGMDVFSTSVDVVGLDSADASTT